MRGVDSSRTVTKNARRNVEARRSSDDEGRCMTHVAGESASVKVMVREPH